MFYIINSKIQNYIVQNPDVIVFFLLIGFVFVASTTWLCIKNYFSCRKKIINRIAVDSKGECYCPTCSKYLNIIEDEKYVGQLAFHCKKCDSTYYPFLENGNYIGANQFYSIQKENPKTTCTSEIMESRINKELIECGLKRG